MAYIELIGLNKSFGNNRVVKDVNLQIAKGEFLTLLGPSGCGKSTTLRMVAGFETADSGRIVIDGKDVTSVPANQRGVGMVFQSYALFPNMTAWDNVAFGLRMQGVAPKDAEGKVEEMLDAVGLLLQAKQFPHQLSGGQQQRVALARALVRQPSVLLLDEPLSALDAKIRVSLRDLIKDLQAKLHITTIYVTHDQEEALSLSDRIAVMNKGEIVQLGNPSEIYSRPTSSFVANFVGTLNVMEAEMVHPLENLVTLAGRPARVPSLNGTGGPKGSKVTVAVRPESVRLYKAGTAPAESDEVRLPGKVVSVSLLGSLLRVRVEVGSSLLAVDVLNNGLHPDLGAGVEVEVGISPESLLSVG